ncbi:MAG: cytochrome c3 family protein [Planctomycetota bacterium]|jgi:formate-dependent nitrite reductase cytochrome c552 subunit
MCKCNNFCVALIVYLSVGVLTLSSCTPAGDSDLDAVPESEREAKSGPPPLVVDTSEPLLLDEPTEEQVAAASTEAAGENMACFVCHANYLGEFLAERHAKANVGCVNCHGDSFAHRNDENNTTPPEIMYPADKIDPFCQACHDAHDVPPKKVVVRWKELDIDKNDPARIVCTDCHGQHRMKVRTVIWDKKTGKLLRTNRGD